MKLTGIAIFAAATVALAHSAVAAPAQGGRMPAPVVFFDIAGPDMARQAAFYRTVFDWDAGPGGQFTAPAASPLPGALRADPADKVIYIGVDDVIATLAKIEANGGKTVAPRFEVKGVVVLGLFTDPAGNRMGLVELKDGKPKIP